MTDAFSASSANFSGMDGERNLYIGEVVHKAFVSVDEAGTEAAAATAVVMRASGIAVEPMVVEVNRPFIFLIYDYPTQTVLFLGRVIKP